ncbi:MAG: GNAT family N-acetyltransferase [Bdellovibrionales bacterium RIFCSPHIGHO2_01_FULL_40_29]|nr:MAG: GNAT family N-acetyltransferase [Bdellovibrionales bacterium RIFCSPHIGHO2_01_FULL_40_29]OFZ35329.1 MAG: GNAT family N-acetyltransferase [Bdellovibrionales bacterium RIFCSPHIGHO2_02_FULL_40_15]
MLIKPFLETDIDRVKKFTDSEIGDGYYSREELIENQKKSCCSNGAISSFLLIDESSSEIKGLRLAYPPGNWSHGKGTALRDDLWPFSIHETAYFQSLFLAKDAQRLGWGPKLSEKSIDVFRQLGAKGIATHSWKESPNNSSVRYLLNIGFKEIIEHPLYWFNVDYICTRDGKPCRCTAVEMYLTL